jgi:GntR family transcriptional regulator/MocR family aminotransferase
VLLSFALDTQAGAPLQRQLYAQVREAVLAGRIAPGTRLPATRALAAELGCARNTVLNAFEQLSAEGYLESRPGSGTYVSRVLPDLLPIRPAGNGDDDGRHGATPLSLGREHPPSGEFSAPDPGAGSALAARVFAPGVPDLSLFPFDVWGRLLGRIWRRPPAALLLPGPPAGYLPLRRAIAAYLRAVRNVACTAEQVLITGGAQPALDLVARVLLEPGDAVWIEEPGYPGLRGPLQAAGARLVPVPVDGAGLSVAAGRALAPAARLAVVAPSHQYPVGTTMDLARRLALLAWAEDSGAWVVEDDYDSEYRYAGRPLAALQGLESERATGGGRVIYIGTFSKVLFPSIRLGYLVVPPDLLDAVLRARAARDAYPSAVVQPALAAFFEEGHFAAHVRRMRMVYGRRRQALLTAADRHLAGLLELSPGQAGLHLVAYLTAGLARRMNDREAERRAVAAGLGPQALSRYYLAPPGETSGGSPAPEGLLLGFAAVPEDEIERGIERLAAALAG